MTVFNICSIHIFKFLEWSKCVRIYFFLLILNIDLWWNCSKACTQRKSKDYIALGSRNMEPMPLSIYWHAKALIPIYSMISCKICSKDLLKNPSSQIKAPRDIRNHWKKPTNCYFLEGVKRSLRTEIIDRHRTQENTTEIILIYYAFLWISLLFCIIIDDFDESQPFLCL